MTINMSFSHRELHFIVFSFNHLGVFKNLNYHWTEIEKSFVAHIKNLIRNYFVTQKPERAKCQIRPHNSFDYASRPFQRLSANVNKVSYIYYYFKFSRIKLNAKQQRRDNPFVRILLKIKVKYQYLLIKIPEHVCIPFISHFIKIKKTPAFRNRNSSSAPLISCVSNPSHLIYIYIDYFNNIE